MINIDGCGHSRISAVGFLIAPIKELRFGNAVKRVFPAPQDVVQD